MKIKRDFPHAVREIENTWIVLSDGTRLAARMWLPDDAGEDNPVPALLEYLPYRKSDGTAVRDALRHPYFAGHGYASIRVDMRGSGDSDGILYDEYLKQEQDDALEVLAWIAAQPWCTGDVGMFGKSWGGFNALQIAARRPPQLKAVIAMHFTDDRYADDVHYMGGCLLTSQMLPWASVMLGYNAAPPDPRFVGERWREMWMARMAQTPPYVEEWLRHQRRDDFWKHGSVSEDYGAIEIPVYAVGGWADAYNNSVPRLLAGLSGPRKGLIGPWSHNFPEQGVPGPAIGFLQESVRWWDHWLKGRDMGIMAEPMLRLWMQEAVRPALFREQRAGRWIAEPAWPSPHVEERLYHLNSDGAVGTLDATPAPEKALSFVGLQQHGLETGEWGANGVRGEIAGDQRASDGQCLSFTSETLQAPLALLGRPRLSLALASDRPLALV
ncbi:MAG TPA: CocE/NonD family hydrolase, partial [Candidatus Binatia bacterium]|nr:CocE/NonD family hydrolase [Candidatus Binatia bacterium]